MSDDNTNDNGNNHNDPGSRASQIDAMVAAAGARVSHSNALKSPTGTQANVKVDSDGNVHFDGPITTPDRIPDSGICLDTARATSEARMEALRARLIAVSFDPVTGASTPVLQGRDRDLVAMQFTTEQNNYWYSEAQFAKIEAQRANDRTWADAEANERLTMLRVTGGNPAKLARLNELLGDEELKTAAKAMLADRFERGRG